MYVLALLPVAIRYAAVIAALVFMSLCWRRTGNVGFGLLALALLSGQLFSIGIPYLLSVVGAPSIGVISAGVSLALALLGAAAWWLIYSGVAKLGPNDSSKPTPLRGAA